MRIHGLIEEIRQLKDKPVHTSTMAIYNMLENNRTLFLQRMDPSDFSHLVGKFESLSQEKPGNYGSSGYTREYEQAFSILWFYLDRII
ncbi:MAG: hypothetical protein JST26_05370 [Bacteroidetes bacterium]|nr:hypothetical protein [Bacteroidota bacterium]